MSDRAIADVTKRYKEALGINREVSLSRQKRGESNLWQRRFWEHLIRDERDLVMDCDDIQRFTEYP